MVTMGTDLQKTEDIDMTIKQRKWLKEYLSTGNAKEAAMRVYDCTEESAGQIGYENMKKLDLSDAMEEAGITDKLLLDTMKEGLKSTKDDGKPDGFLRHMYLQTAMKVKKKMAADPSVAVQVAVIISEGKNNEDSTT